MKLIDKNLRSTPLLKRAAAQLTTKPANKAKSHSHFGKDELSIGRGKALRLEVLKKGSVSEAAAKLGEKTRPLVLEGINTELLGRTAERINRQLDVGAVVLDRALPKSEAPHQGKDGRMYAPNGDPLVEVPLSESNYGTAETKSSRKAYVNPKTHEYYVVERQGTIGPTIEKSYGPFSMPQVP